MPPIRGAYNFRFDHQAPQLSNIQHIIVSSPATNEVTHSDASLIDVDKKSSVYCPTVSMETASIDQESVKITQLRRSAKSTNHTVTSLSSSTSTQRCSPRNSNDHAPTETRNQAASISRSNRNQRSIIINRYLTQRPLSVYVKKRFPWLQDRPFLNLALAGQLLPIDLIRLVDPDANDFPSQHVSISIVNTRSSAQRFVDFFSTVPIFASAWLGYGELMADAAVDNPSTDKIFRAMSTYLRYLVHWSFTHKWSACMYFHHALQFHRKCSGPFDAGIWLQGVETSLEKEYFNAQSLLDTPGSASSSASASATSTATASIAVEPEINYSNAPAATRAAVLTNRRRLCKAVGVCIPWNERSCPKTCPKGYKHLCWVCGGAHPGCRCPDDMST